METTKEETGREGWMGSNNRGTGGPVVLRSWSTVGPRSKSRGTGGPAVETLRRHWIGVDTRGTEGPKEPQEDIKRLKKLIFLSRITG